MVLIMCLPSLIFAHFIFGVSRDNFGLAKNKDLSIELKFDYFVYFKFQIKTS